MVEGEDIRTLANSVVEVELECGSALRLAPESEMTMTRLRLQDGVPLSTVTLNTGEAFFSLGKADSRYFQTLLPGGEIGFPSGGAQVRLNAPAGQPASVEVLHGRVRVRAGSQASFLSSSHRSELPAAGGILALPLLAPDGWQRWSHARDDLFERAALASSPLMPPVEFVPPPPVSGVNAGTSNPEPAMLSKLNHNVQIQTHASPVAVRPVLPPVPACAGN